ncbi:MAG: hypothetical protein B6D61_06310 [Bacteroidetes bacterium 4484_249]|nr:MAG: hypothetical protein B6D61_06310 [Bacteroidetes bacterium 4484_249]
MKRINLFFIQIVVFLSFTAAGQTIVSTETENITPVIFDFTGIHCVSCPNAHLAIEVAKEHYPQVVALTFHTGNYAAPNPGEPDFRTIQGDSLVNNFAYWDPIDNIYKVVWSYPTVCLNGTGVKNNVVNDTNLFLQKVSEVINEEAIVNVGAIAYVDTLKRKIKIEVECYYTASASDSNYLTVSLTQNGLKSTQAGAGEDYVHKEMFRQYISNVWGDTLGIPEEGDLIQKTYSLNLPDSIKYHDSDAIELILRNIQIQTFITGNDTLTTAYDFFGNAFKNRRAFDILNGTNAAIEFVDLQGVYSLNNKPALVVFPNPAKQFLYVDLLSDISGNGDIKADVLNIEGHLIRQVNLLSTDKESNYYIPLKGLKSGMYLLHLHGDRIYSTTRFVIE